ncbi:hypothetical protein G3480_05030 [Thiorhodococcus mannitoliphagus]|uniref:Uncharacterized protein n=1 Tax=Thiorhodococcus mannitoliphagus TaxID=329406 RepID=A0A6P1DR96_9GAMM|nr:hypothetical protein [Thiorhodococcus mannitoliphagus]NEX19683.1 hypothetical protein [Thiorhodococcus mannitoliphagus]
MVDLNGADVDLTELQLGLDDFGHEGCDDEVHQGSFGFHSKTTRDGRFDLEKSML